MERNPPTSDAPGHTPPETSLAGHHYWVLDCAQGTCPQMSTAVTGRSLHPPPGVVASGGPWGSRGRACRAQQG